VEKTKWPREEERVFSVPDLGGNGGAREAEKETSAFYMGFYFGTRTLVRTCCRLAVDTYRMTCAGHTGLYRALRTVYA
jgi:hypothetical protein